MRSLLTNTEAMQAMMQIQQGMQRLQQAAPGINALSGLGFGGMPQTQPAPSATAPSATAPSGTAPTGQSNPTNPMLNPQASQYFSQMLNMMGNQTIVSYISKFQLKVSKRLL